MDKEGHHVQWEVELWEWTDYLHSGITMVKKVFNFKAKAQYYIRTKLEFGNVNRVVVTRLTYDQPQDCRWKNESYSDIPSRKVMLDKEFRV
jgi:hypothetical protein